MKGFKARDSLPSIEKTIDQKRILRWAMLSGDYNRLHVDPQYAKQTRFKGTITHGPMSLAFLNELMIQCFEERWALKGQLLDVRFIAPIRPGDFIRTGGMVREVVEKEGEKWVECDLFIEKYGGEKVVIGRATVPLFWKVGYER